MKTVFIRALEAQVDAKAAIIRRNASSIGPERVDLDPHQFAMIPSTPFPYWVSKTVLEVFSRFQAFGARYDARQGIATADDPRFLRLSWEIHPGRATAGGWLPYVKGGRVVGFYSDIELCINFGSCGREIAARVNDHGIPKSNIWMLERTITEFFGRKGITWSRRGSKFAPRALPEGCVFSVRGESAFLPVEQLEPVGLALFNSTIFDYLFKISLGRFGHPEFIIGTLKNLPVPDFTVSDFSALRGLAQEAWSRARRLDTRSETSHAFLLPALLQANADDFAERAQRWTQYSDTTQAELNAIATEIDGHAFRLYGISAEDRKRIVQGVDTDGEAEAGLDDDNDEAGQDEDVAEADAAPMVASLLSWTLGAAFGRFDVRLATGEREAPPEPEPFDPLPVCSPGMLTGDDGLPVTAPPSGYPLTFPTDGVLVDDPGHPRDVVRAVRSVFETVFDDANARWHEAAELLGAPDLRTWFARDFLEPHIKRYSKSRRKAPIYWQLATASGSYSVWLYIHRATGDTLFRVLNDFVGPKLDHEKAKLAGLTQEAGGPPSAAQRREIEQQETFVGELQALKTEVARVAPLWRPNLDDGVILNFAPLWRLVPQSRSWQAECKKAWEKLVAGDYDWAHLAMHLWPERVIPKCMDDRSLAIAHGLEDVFWHEDDSGTWRKSRVDDATVQRLSQERTSTTVKAALNDLLSAPALTASKGRKAKGRTASPRTSATKSAPSAARATTSDTPVDEATLRAVKTAIASVADGASKADVLAATGLSDGDWNNAIAALLDRGEVIRDGKGRGTRYYSGKEDGE